MRNVSLPPPPPHPPQQPPTRPQNPSINLNKTRSIHRSRRNRIITLEALASPLHQRRNSQAIRKPLVKRKARLKLILALTLLDRRDGNRDRHILPRQVHNRIGARGNLPRDGKLELHVLGLGRRDNGQGAEGGQINLIQRLRARPRHNKHLNRGERKARGPARQKRRRGRRLLLYRPIEADLLAFLREDGAEERDQGALVGGVGGEDGLGFGQGPEDDVGEGLGEGDGLGEAGDGELVLAGLDGGVFGAGEDAVDARGVEFLLLRS